MYYAVINILEKLPRASATRSRHFTCADLTLLPLCLAGEGLRSPWETERNTSASIGFSFPRRDNPISPSRRKSAKCACREKPTQVSTRRKGRRALTLTWYLSRMKNVDNYGNYIYIIGDTCAQLRCACPCSRSKKATRGADRKLTLIDSGSSKHAVLLATWRYCVSREYRKSPWALPRAAIRKKRRCRSQRGKKGAIVRSSRML